MVDFEFYLKKIVTEALREESHSIALEVAQIIKNNSIEPEEDLTNLEGAAKLTGLAKSTIYQLIHSRTIPYIKRKGTKKLYFSKIDLREWILNRE